MAGRVGRGRHGVIMLNFIRYGNILIMGGGVRAKLRMLICFWKTRRVTI